MSSVVPSGCFRSRVSQSTCCFFIGQATCGCFASSPPVAPVIDSPPVLIGRSAFVLLSPPCVALNFSPAGPLPRPPPHPPLSPAFIDSCSCARNGKIKGICLGGLDLRFCPDSRTKTTAPGSLERQKLERA